MSGFSEIPDPIYNPRTRTYVPNVCSWNTWDQAEQTWTTMWHEEYGMDWWSQKRKDFW